MWKNSWPPERILLVRTDRIGDVVLTTPAATLLRKQFPNAYIAFLTRVYTAPLLQHYQHIDEVLTYPPEGQHGGWQGHRQLRLELRSKNFDTAILFYPQFRLARAIFQAGIPNRLGTGYRWYSFLFNHRHFEHRKQGKKHELEYNLSLLAPLIGKPSPTICFHFKLKERLLVWREAQIDRLGLQDGFAIVHPGSGGSAPNIPVAYYRRIIKILLQQTSWKILLSGLKSEHKLIEEIAQNFPSTRLLTVSGQFTIEELMAIISSARLFISSSTGPLHIANALGIPILAFYCPARPCSPRRWGPYHQQQWVLVPDVPPCNTCNLRKCPHGNCLAKLPFSRIEQLLKKRLENLS